MAEEPTMKLYVLSVAATHTGGEATAIGVQTAVAALPAGVSAQEAGLQIARNIFSVAEGWGDHYVNIVEITQGFPLAQYRLEWHLEKGE